MKIVLLPGIQVQRSGSLYVCFSNYRVKPMAGHNSTVKPVSSGHSKKTSKYLFSTDSRLMQVKSIAECSIRAFCNAFDLH